MNDNLYALFQKSFEHAFDKPYLVTPKGTVTTYGELDELSAKFAAQLLGLGVAPGDRIVAQIDKSVGAVALYLGALRAGAVFVPLNTAYTANEVAYFLEDAEPKLLVCRPQDIDALGPITKTCGVANVQSMGWAARLDDASDFWSTAAACSPAHDIVARAADDLASILYTSGTTGRSKGAMLTHENLRSNALALHKLWGFVPNDVLLHALPIFHIHGLFVALHTALINASTILFLEKFDVEQVRAELSKASVMMGVPTFYTRLLAAGLSKAECNHMRLFISGSAPLTAQASDEWAARTGHRILERYGMTEAGMITSNPLEGERIAGTVGYALPGVEVRVADEKGDEQPRGEIGVIEVRGPNIFKGYWRMSEKTREEFRSDGFFITGDNGVMAPDGRVTIVGRAKDLIISGGYNIYPKEIEAVLDDIYSVKESAVVGAPHKDLGEGVVAVLVADKEKVSDHEIEAALNERLARFKHPRKFFWVDELPRNAMGKVQKTTLRKAYRDVYKA